MPRHTYVFSISAYFCPNGNIVPHAVRTNKPSNTWCRAPGSYNLFLIWDPFNKAYRTTCSRARDKEKLSKVKKKALKNEFMTIWLLFNVLQQNQWVKETNPIAIISWKIYYLELIWNFYHLNSWRK